MTDTLRPGAPPPQAPPPRPSGPAPIPMPSLTKGGLKGCYQGPPMSGKSDRAATWPAPVFIQHDPDARTVLKKTPRVPVLYLPVERIHQEVLPAIRTRTIDELVHRIVDPDTGEYPFKDYVTRTIVWDSWTFYAANVLQLCPAGSTSNKHEPWQKLLDRCRITANILNNATVPDAQGRWYHYVATIHEEDLVDPTDGKVVEVWPTLQGKFANEFFANFSFIFQTEVVGPGQYTVRTRPTKLRPRMGDRVGGGGLGVLPAECAGDYETLMKAWKLPV